MQKHKKVKNIFISIAGVNDSGKKDNKIDGVILTALGEYYKAKKVFDKVIIIYTLSEESEFDFYKIGKYVLREIKSRKYCKEVEMIPMELENVINHNEIYPKLLSICKDNSKKCKDKCEFTASISSGTPAMSVCWILMAESGDFKINLIQVSPPRFGKKIISEVKLGTALPRIKRLEGEVENLLPELLLDKSNGRVYINGIDIEMSPTEFSYYRYFVERKVNKENDLRVSGIYMPDEFVKKVMVFYKEGFPEEDINIRKLSDIQVSSFRSTRSKLNNKIKDKISDSYSKYVELYSDGNRRAITYEIKLNPEKIKII